MRQAAQSQMGRILKRMLQRDQLATVQMWKENASADVKNLLRCELRRLQEELQEKEGELHTLQSTIRHQTEQVMTIVVWTVNAFPFTSCVRHSSMHSFPATSDLTCGALLGGTAQPRRQPEDRHSPRQACRCDQGRSVFVSRCPVVSCGFSPRTCFFYRQ